MKISSSLGLAQPTSFAQLPTSSTGSFAALLASGRSVNQIRSERAFAFSETGLFGATRLSKQLNATPAGSVAGPVRAATSLRPAQAETGTVSRVRLDSIGLQSNSVQAGTSRPLLLNGLRFDATKVATHNSISFKTVSYCNTNRNMSLPIEGPQCPKNIRHLVEQRKRYLAISGSDDALCVSISEFVVNCCEQNDLYVAFFSTVHQFGMNLESVRLCNFDKHLLGNIVVRRR